MGNGCARRSGAWAMSDGFARGGPRARRRARTQWTWRSGSSPIFPPPPSCRFRSLHPIASTAPPTIAGPRGDGPRFTVLPFASRFFRPLPATHALKGKTLKNVLFPTITLVPHQPGIAPVGGDMHVLVRVSVPVRPEARQRPDLNLAIVIDQSGSMRGGPLEEAKRAARNIVHTLVDGDRVAIVSYDDEVRLQLASAPAQEARAAAEGAIARICAGGSTALHDGWRAGADQALLHASAQGISRVLLLSDGKANCGLRDAGSVARRCAERAAKRVSTSTYGLGHGFNEDLMTRMAVEGGGRAHYAETAADLMSAFRREIDALAATIGIATRLEATGKVAVLNDYVQAPDGRHCLPDLLAGAETWAMLRLSLPEAAEGETHSVTVRIFWSDPFDGAERQGEATLALPVVAEFDALPRDEIVGERLRELEAARLQKEAEEAARRDDWDEVDERIALMRRKAGDNAYVASMASEMQEMARLRNPEAFAKEARYARTTLSRRHVAPREDHRSIEAGEGPSFTVRRARQGKDQ